MTIQEEAHKDYQLDRKTRAMKVLKERYRMIECEKQTIEDAQKRMQELQDWIDAFDIDKTYF